MAASPESGSGATEEPAPRPWSDVLSGAIKARWRAAGLDRDRVLKLTRATETSTGSELTRRSPSELPAVEGHALLRTRTTPPGFRS